MCESDPAAINPNATTKDKRAWCMGGSLCGNKADRREKGVAPDPFFTKAAIPQRDPPMCLARLRPKLFHSFQQFLDPPLEQARFVLRNRVLPPLNPIVDLCGFILNIGFRDVGGCREEG